MTTAADDTNLAPTPANDDLVPTPRTILGPYFTLGMGLRSAVEPGDDRASFTVTGRVLNGVGQP
ncbi:MAG TPA: hypothetical protein VD859_11980, partial [Nocardioides sp.]|nr:hypothetical protein [Nocardioides sp.]